MKNISVAIITKNEEANIRACLESVRWADDIVVVDSGSTDRTLQILGEFPARVYTEEWQGFARQKNSAIAKARREWILSLDADERVPEKLQEEIARVLNSDSPADGYFLARKNYFLGRWIRRCGWYPDHNLRLFRKERGRFEEREVHERVTVQGRVAYLREPLEHHTYRTLSDFLQRLDRYSSLGAREMRREGRPFRHRDLLLRPPWTFLQMYLFRGGFLEGYFGFLLSVLYSFYTFAKYSKLKEIRCLEDPRPAK
jgi:glycosyltransferase involved in cell wall biosynthesis